MEYQTVGDPSQTGKAVYVDKLQDIERFKSGGVYVFDRPIVFTQVGPPLDLIDCPIAMAIGGSLHASDPTYTSITASAIGATPFITATGSLSIYQLGIVGVQVAFDLDGTTGGPAALVHFSEVHVSGCASLGTFANYGFGCTFLSCNFFGCGQLVLSNFTGGASLQFCGWFSMTGGLVFSGPFGSATMNTCLLFPGPGVTAISATTAPATSFGGTLKIVDCPIALPSASSVGVDIPLATGFSAERFVMEGILFTDGAGGPPVGTPIPVGAHDADSNATRISDCPAIKNSSTSAYYTTAANTEPTPNVAPGTPVVAVLVPPLGVVDVDTAEKFDVDTAGRVTYTGGLQIRGKVTWIMSISGQANRVATAYVGTGSTGAIPVPAAAVLKTGVEAPLGVGGNATSITVIHEFDMAPGSFAEPWIDATSGEPRVASIKAFVEKVG